MFDVKLYDETGERETIRGLSWSQMTVVQSVVSRLHFLLGNKKYKHTSNQVSDENRIAALEAERDELIAALKKILPYVEDAANKKSEFSVNWVAVNSDEGKQARAVLAKVTK